MKDVFDVVVGFMAIALIIAISGICTGAFGAVTYITFKAVVGLFM